MLIDSIAIFSLSFSVIVFGKNKDRNIGLRYSSNWETKKLDFPPRNTGLYSRENKEDQNCGFSRSKEGLLIFNMVYSHYSFFLIGLRSRRSLTVNPSRGRFYQFSSRSGRLLRNREYFLRDAGVCYIIESIFTLIVYLPTRAGKNFSGGYWSRCKVRVTL